MGSKVIQRRRDLAGDRAFHVDRASAIERPAAISAANGGCVHFAASPGGTTSVCPAKARWGPLLPIRAYRFSTGDTAWLGEGDAMHLEAGRLEHGFNESDCACFGGSNRGTAKKIAGKGDGVHVGASQAGKRVFVN